MTDGPPYPYYDGMFVDTEDDDDEELENESEFCECSVQTTATMKPLFNLPEWYCDYCLKRKRPGWKPKE